MQSPVTRLGLLAVLFAVSASWVFAAASNEQPATEVHSSGTQYISPNGDDIQESSELSFAVTIYVKSLEGYIPEYGLRILDSSQNVILETIELQESDVGWLGRLFRQYEAFTLEKVLRWDGTDAEGNVVPDGEYGIEIWVVDPLEQREDITLDNFVIDTTPPSVTVALSEPAIFSPNGDGNIDSYTIEQSGGSSEDLWSGSIVDVDGNVVKSLQWSNQAPDSITWDGTNDAGEVTSDGAHRFRISATDRAGNSFSDETGEFQLVTIETPLYVTLDEQYISPNSDGIQDVITVALDQDVAEDVVRWSVVIDDGEGNVIRQFGGEGPPPEKIEFDGVGDGGQPADDDVYRAVYSLRYRNGNAPFVVSELFVIDNAKPEIDVVVSLHTISPNGDGRFEETSVSFRSSETVVWSGEIVDSSGSVVDSTDSTRTTSLIVWRGRNSENRVVSDGVYSLQARFTDVAGNTTEIPDEKFIVDVTPPTVTFEIDKDYFSPDGDGLKDSLTAHFTATEPVRGLLELSDSAGRTVGTLGGFGRAYQLIDGNLSYTWGGITGTGLYLTDDVYTVVSTYEDHAGNRVELDDRSFTVDTRRARLAATAPKGFSPNTDGRNDTLTVSVDANFYDTVERWKLEFIDGSGKVLREVEGTETLPKEFTWDGAMQFAESTIKAPEGLYHARISATYRKGDSVEARTDPFFVDVTPPAVNLQATADPFATTDGTISGDLYITLQIDDAHDVADWSMDILTSDNEIVRSFTGEGDLEDQIVWRADQPVSNIPVTELMRVVVGVVDSVGNFTTFEEQVPVDILVVNRDGKLYLMVPNVIFGAYQHDLESRGAEQFQKNLESIQRVVEIYNKYPDHTLLLEGHALNIYRGDAERESAEEEVLVPLTERRAEMVGSALVEFGLSEELISAEWFGGTRPMVDVHDRETRWKNRRVEFIMERPEKTE